MTTVTELQARVASSYERLGLPTWADPHPAMASPRDEEYSRLTDAARYRIVHARARAWATTLADALGVRSEALEPAPATDADAEPFDRGVRLVPRHSDALPLLLFERDVHTQPDQGTLAVLTIAVARPDIVVETQPDCGCDACDSGSSDLLGAVDAPIRHVVGGPFVVLRGSRWHAQWYPGGGSAGGTGPRFRVMMDLCRRLAEGGPFAYPPTPKLSLAAPGSAERAGRAARQGGADRGGMTQLSGNDYATRLSRRRPSTGEPTQAKRDPLDMADRVASSVVVVANNGWIESDARRTGGSGRVARRA